MSFSCPIWVGTAHGVEVKRIEFALTILSPAGEFARVFRLDTGADATTVSEDVAATLHLPSGGTPISATGVGGPTAGRLVDVRYRFPPDDLSGYDGIEVESRWLVVPTRTGTAMLSLADVHRHFTVGTDDTFAYFAER